MINNTTKRTIKAVIGIKCIVILIIAVLVLGKKEKSGAVGFVRIGKNINRAAWIGIEVVPVNGSTENVSWLPSKRGLLVRRVFKDSPAYRHGLRRGDVIQRIGSTRIRNFAQFKKIVNRSGPGRGLRIVVNRKNERKTLYVRVDLKPKNMADPNLRNTAYYNYPRQYRPPVNRPYPYFYFGGEYESEIERE